MTNDQLCSSIFPLLAQCAQDHCTITYSALGRLVGVYHRDRALHFALGSIWQWCQENHHPHINAIVVRKSGARKGLPGLGYTPSGIPHSSARLGGCARRRLQPGLECYISSTQLA